MSKKKGVKAKKILADEELEIVVDIGQWKIYYKSGGVYVSGNLALIANDKVKYSCASPFVLFIKEFAPTVIAAGAAANPRESPFDDEDNNGFVWYRKNAPLNLKVKGKATKGIYSYGVAVLTGNGLVLDDPQIIIY